MTNLAKYEAAAATLKALVAAEKQSLKCADMRQNLDAGSSRSRVTTANAKWSTAAEHRDRVFHEAHCKVVEAGLAAPFSDDYYGTFSSSHAWSPIQIIRRRPNLN